MMMSAETEGWVALDLVDKLDVAPALAEAEEILTLEGMDEKNANQEVDDVELAVMTDNKKTRETEGKHHYVLVPPVGKPELHP